MSAPILRVCVQRETNDCAVAALAMLLGRSYEDVLRAVTVSDKMQGRTGLWTKTMQRIARRLGFTLRVRRLTDLDAYGIIRLYDHAVVLRSGLIINPGDGTIWDADAYLSNYGVTPDDCQLLVAEEIE